MLGVALRELCVLRVKENPGQHREVTAIGVQNTLVGTVGSWGLPREHAFLVEDGVAGQGMAARIVGALTVLNSSWMEKKNRHVKESRPKPAESIDGGGWTKTGCSWTKAIDRKAPSVRDLVIRWENSETKN